jgi:diguanylate cyclase
MSANKQPIDLTMDFKESDEKDWKTKYFDSLQQMEDMESSWTELDELLRKTISRLSTTAKGMDQKLDNVLHQIQLHARNKEDDLLPADLEKLSQLINQIDVPLPPGAETIKSVNVSSAQDYTFNLINKLSVDSSLQERFETFKSSIQSLDNEQSLHKLADFINQLLQQDTQDHELIREVLITLVEKISLSYGNSAHLDLLKQKLEDQPDLNEWHQYLDEIIAEIRIIIRGINHEKVELEGLVADVTKQLSEISDTLLDEQSDSLQGRKESENLKSMMNDSVGRIQQQVQDESDIKVLKNSIKEDLGSIKQGVEEFVTKDAERFKISEQRNNKLQQQIKFMEQESNELRNKLTENRQKLMFDTLTGVRSRLAYEETFEQELARWSRYQEIFSFAILDIDHFKRINDEYGHNAGDKALQIVARMMSEHIRKTDYLFRIGGEEFVLLLPKTGLDHATPLVEKIRNSVGDSKFHFKKEKVKISMSAGLTAVMDDDNTESIYERADLALYDAKNSGRDQLIVKSY